MRRVCIAWLVFVTISLLVVSLGSSAFAADPVSKDYGDLTLNSPWTATHWDDVWDLTQGDLTLSYHIDMTGLHQPGTWNTYDGSTSYTEVGLRGEGAGDFNPGPFGIYQGRCGGWMVSDDDTWNDGDGFTEKGNPNPDSIQDLDDKHGLQASGGRGERDYDVLLSDPDTVGATRPDPWYPGDPTKVIGAYGSFNNVGIWWDRDGVDPYQSPTYANTGGHYDMVITYHAIDAGLGVMFATVNGLPQGFYADPANWDGTPEYIPAGLSFKGDMKHMQVFAGLWAPDASYGPIGLSNINVTGVPGVSDPLVADFTYTPGTIEEGDTVQFTDASHGGMPPYTYAWDFNNDGVVDSTEPNPTNVFAAAGTYNVKLTVTPFRCTPQKVIKTIKVCKFEVTSITPTPAIQHSVPVCARIYGCCFESGATVKLVQGTTVLYPVVVQFVSSSEIDASFSLVGAPTGKYDVVVTNPDGSEARLVGGFEITPACGAGGGSAAIMFGITLGLMSAAGSGHLLRRRKRQRP